MDQRWRILRKIGNVRGDRLAFGRAHTLAEGRAIFELGFKNAGISGVARQGFNFEAVAQRLKARDLSGEWDMGADVIGFKGIHVGLWGVHHYEFLHIGSGPFS